MSKIITTESRTVTIPANTTPILAKFMPSVQSVTYELIAAYIRVTTSSLPGNVKLRISLNSNGNLLWYTISAGIQSQVTNGIILSRGTPVVEVALGSSLPGLNGDGNSVNFLDSFPTGIKLNSSQDFLQVDAMGVAGQAYSITFNSTFMYEYDC